MMKILKRLFWFSMISAAFVAADLSESTSFNLHLIQDAEARVGRPLTPVSVAGVRRRTRRRTAVATAAVVRRPVAVAPAPAPTVIVVPQQAPAYY